MGKDVVLNANDLVPSLLDLPQAPCPVAHYFGPGVYIREVTIPAGVCAIGRYQKQEHTNIILRGKVAMFTEQGTVKEVSAPSLFVGQPGQKMGYAIETTVWLNVFANPDNCRDLDELERRCFSDSQELTELEHETFRRAVASAQRDRDDYRQFLDEYDLTEESIQQQVHSESWDDTYQCPIIRIAESPINGLGVYCTSYVLPMAMIGYGRLNGQRTNIGRYVNHSAEPNCEYRRLGDDIGLFAIKQIDGALGGLKGEEVTIDYRTICKL